MQLPIENLYPAKLFKLLNSQAIVYVHPCNKCNDPLAPFGYGDPKAKPGQWKATRWFCSECKPDKAGIQEKLL